MEFNNSQKSAQNVTAKSATFTGSTAVAKPAASGAERVGHKLELDHERAMSMTGVKDVPVFTDKNITVRLANETLLVTGQNLAVKNLDVESGKLQVTGRVFSLRYTSQTAPTSIIKRIFK
ncbi:MAG: YabP/YqfC family sporulation protein [Bacteroides sp.]|nr:YabP/YqfC family sporulation protein [Bacillota bacterium]MCM1394077.1 YabP/YqfC family sporulation protein [[Eubacterium] siraeum]MCM1455853.1 YabP/YqfC family sporulation protein [Bacteroides sp.]